MVNVSTQKAQRQSSGFVQHAKAFMGKLGRIGKALLFPIAMLPIAAIMLRIGAQLPGDTAFAHFIQSCFTSIGNGVFKNLPIIFAVGVGFGLTRDNRGEAALSALVGMLVLQLLMGSTDGTWKGAAVDLPDQIYHKSQDFHKLFGSSYDNILANNVLNGIIAGGLVAFIYNRFHGVELPKVLGFFSGRRLVPVLSILAIVFFAIVYAVVFPWIGFVLYKLSDALGAATGNRWSNAAIQGVYVTLNRFLIPFGLHHIPNTLFWFQLGSAVTDQGLLVQGDINIFLQGAAAGNHSGAFQSGFFPMMMFGLPALVAAIYVCADNKEQKLRVIAMLGGAALVSFLTGITEPIEFAFLFASPLLYGVHALLGGIFAFITGLFGTQLGFGFSAGLFDYLLSIPKSMDIINANRTGIDAVMANPGWLFAIGALCAATYFFTAKFLIKKFNIQTPGRGVNQISGADEATIGAQAQAEGLSARAAAIVGALGGYGNITSFQNCATRLRYDVKDSSIVDKEALKKAGAIGTMIVSPTHVQVIIGPTVEILNNEIIANKNQVVPAAQPAKTA